MTVRVREIMTEDPLTLPPEATLREAAEAMASAHVTGLPVVRGSRVVGVISATDLVEFGATSTATAELGAGQEGGAREESIQIWDEGDDPLSRFFVEPEDTPEDPEEWDEGWEDLVLSEADDRSKETILDRYTVEDLMTRTLCALPPDADVREAAEYMLRAAVHRILLLEDEKLVGIVTTTDMVQAVARHGLAS